MSRWTRITTEYGNIITFMLATLTMVTMSVMIFVVLVQQRNIDRIEVVERVVRAECNEAQSRSEYAEGCQRLLNRIIHSARPDQVDALLAKRRGVNGA